LIRARVPRMERPDMTPAANILTLVLFCLAALAALCAAAWWLMRAAAMAKAPPADAEMAVYRSQLAELEKDLAAGRLAPEAADAARLEIGRRLVRAEARQAEALAKAGGGSAAGARAASGPVMLALAALVAAGSVGLYLVRGTLEPDRPFGERKREMLAQDPRSLSDEEILTILQERARAAPQDPAPHLFMGQILAETNREGDAIRAFQAALRRDPRNVDAMAELGGLVLRGNDGVMTEQAQAIFAQAQGIEPDHPMVRYYLALAKWQAGERAAALADWRTAWLGLEATDPRRTTLLARVVSELSRIETGPGAPGTGPAGNGTAGTGAAGAGGAQAQGPFEAMASLPEAERAAFIGRMVAQRAARQAAAPRDLGLRLSLLRVTAMTGDRAAAERLIADGLRLAADDRFEQAVLVAAAQSVGLPVALEVTGGGSVQGEVAK
jgi:cytochrome c-type biogenesis protein CcmH